MTGEGFERFHPGAKVRFHRGGRDQQGEVVARWRGSKGYRVMVQTTQGTRVEVQPVEDELELDT